MVFKGKSSWKVENIISLWLCHFAVNTAELGVLLLVGSEGWYRTLEGHMWVLAPARAESAARAQGEGGTSQEDCKGYFWLLPGWQFLLRGGVCCLVVLGLYCLYKHNFGQSWDCCSSSCRLLLWKKVGSWVLLYFNHLMTLCPAQYQFVKVSAALHKIKSLDILHPSSKCNKNILSDLSQWHSAGENLSRGVWPSALERHIKIIPPCYVVVLDSHKFQLGGCHLRAQRWMKGCKLQLVLG